MAPIIPLWPTLLTEQRATRAVEQLWQLWEQTDKDLADNPVDRLTIQLRTGMGAQLKYRLSPNDAYTYDDAYNTAKTECTTEMIACLLHGVSFVSILCFSLEVHNVNDPLHNMVGEAVEQAHANAIRLSNNQALRYDYRPPTAKKPTMRISADFIVLPEER